MTPERTDLLLREYQEANAHLRANTTQFISWFSFFLAFSFVAAAAYVIAAPTLPGWRGVAVKYGIPFGFLLLHMLAFMGIVAFRRYIIAVHNKIDEITATIDESGGSPIPARFFKWMTNLMAAGYVPSYFVWLALLFMR